MKKFLLLLAALCLVAGAAQAAKVEGKPTSLSRGALDCTGAIPIACGDVYTGDTTGGAMNVATYDCTSWNEGGPEVVHVLELPYLGKINAVISGLSSDLDVFLLGSCEEADCLAYGNTSFTTDCLDPGTYYIVVDGYGTAAGPYTLTVNCTECLPPPANDDCDGAIDLQEQGLSTFTVDLCAYTNQYSGAYGDCTGYSDAGADAIYKIYLTAGEIFNVTEDGTHDMSLYLVTDCADIIGTCVAGSDNCCSGAQEIVSYAAEADGWYYLIVDGYNGCGEVTVTITDPIATDPETWGSVKSLYR
jgi:hypothetical protein